MSEPLSSNHPLVSTDLEIGVQVDPGPHRNCSRCGQPCNVEVCAACAREPLSSNQRCEQHGSERCCITAECEVRWQRDEIERLRERVNGQDEQIERNDRMIERLHHDLDNERSAMRNVQECAESYRRERDEARAALKDAQKWLTELGKRGVVPEIPQRIFEAMSKTSWLNDWSCP